MSKNVVNLYNLNIYETPGCTLQAHGVGFEPDVFLSETNFTRKEILAKGVIGLPDEVREKINKGKLPYPGAFDIFDMPFLLISVSKASELSLQIEEATLFLRRCLDDVKKLQGYAHIENILLQFVVGKYESLSESQNLSSEFYDLYSKSGIQGLLFGNSNHP